MTSQTLQNGDPFERDHSEWIQRHLPRYEATWSKYIGNDGSSHSFNIPGLTEEQKHAHKLFCQAHYSLALFAFLLDRHTDEAVAQIAASVERGAHRTVEAYLRDTQNFTLFIALLGQVCDMVELLGAALNRNQIAAQIAPFAKKRNNAIHTARIPLAWDYAGLKIGRIAGLADEEGKWKKGVPWDTLDATDFLYLEDWMRDTRKELLDLLGHTISDLVWGGAKDRFGETGVVRPAEAEKPRHSGASGYSGSDSQRRYISGSNFPSGNYHGR